MYITNLQYLFSEFKIEIVIKEYIPSWDEKSNIKCPFHEEKTPSFSISKSKNLASCFGGCELRLSPVKFIQEKEGCSFVEAVVKCAKIHRLEVKYDNRKLSPEQQARYQAKQEECLSLWMLNKMVAQTYLNYTYGNTIPAKFDFKHGDQVRSLSKKTIEKFGVAMAPDSWDFLTKQFDKKQLEKLGLIKEKDKTKGSYYDFFRNRQMFPIHGNGNQIVGFAGRAVDLETKAKYLNSPESVIYKKKNNLYGLYLQSNFIRKNDLVYLAEGYWDVLTPYDRGFEGIVATCGTALTVEQIQLVKRFTKRVCYLADNDSSKKKNAGLDAVKRGTPKLIKSGLQVFMSILPDNEDPDSFMRKVGAEEFGKYVDSNMQDAFLWTIKEHWEASTKDGFAQAEVQQYVLDVLVHLSNDTIIDYYARKCCTIIGVAIGTFRTSLRDAQAKYLTSVAVDNKEINDSGYTVEQQKSIMNYGMYEKNRTIVCTKSDGSDVVVSNFIVVPLFHLYSKDEPKRIFELINTIKQRRVIDTDTSNLVSLDKFKNVVEAVGNYVYSGSANQYNRLKRKMYDMMETCYSVDTLGYHLDGFYTFGNGVYSPEGEFIPVDKYGIVEYKKKQYFLPAMSEIYKGSDNQYVEEKNFLYVESKVIFKDWATLFCQVHGKAGKIALCFYLAALFRSVIQSTVKVPLLNLFGQPGTGKSLLAENIMGMFLTKSKTLNIHSTTNVALFNKLMSVRDGLVLFEEYKNSINSTKIEACKSIYDGDGRERGQKTKSKNITTPIYSTVILAGQELPTADPALFSRCVSLSFSKTKYSVKEKDRANQLMNMRGKVSNITAQITTYRTLMKEKYDAVFNAKFAAFRNAFIKKNQDINLSRLIENYTVLLATHKVLSEVLEFPFTEEELFEVCIENMIHQDQQMGDENEVSVFFTMVEFLANSKLISEGADFFVKYDDRKRKVLYLKFSKVYGLYMTHHRQQYNKPGIPKTSLQHYLKTHPSFIKTVKSARFEDKVTSAFLFDYNKLNLSLVKENKEEEKFSPNETIHPVGSDEFFGEMEEHLNKIQNK